MDNTTGRMTVQAMSDTARNHYVQIAVVGFGVAWLLARMVHARRAAYAASDEASLGYDRARAYEDIYSPGRDDEERARGRDYASEASRAIRRTGQRAVTEFERLTTGNTLLAGAAALMLGAVLGLVIPESEHEARF